jgi:hypothetical protein
MKEKEQMTILGKEVADCVSARLTRKGFELEPSAKTFFISPVWARSWNLKSDGIELATMSVSAYPWVVLLNVSTGAKAFSHAFKLRNTDSPRRIACLLISWLKQAQIRQIMTD